MLKFKKIEITIDPVYKSADEILSRIKYFYFVSRSVLCMLTFIIVMGLAVLIVVFLDNDNSKVIWMPITFGCAFFLFCLIMVYYFASMGLQLISIMKQEGQEINTKLQLAQFVFISFIFLSGLLQYSLVQVLILSLIHI